MAIVICGVIFGASFDQGWEVGWVVDERVAPVLARRRLAGRVAGSGTVAAATKRVPPSPCVLGLTIRAAPSSARKRTRRRAKAGRRAAGAGEVSGGLARVVVGAVAGRVVPEGCVAMGWVAARSRGARPNWARRS